MLKILLKRVLPSVIVLALLVLGALWLYGFIGVKAVGSKRLELCVKFGKIRRGVRVMSFMLND